MSKDVNSMRVGGDVEITEISLINFRNQTLNIKSLFTTIHIYEDIFSNSLSGSIQIIDTVDLINSLPIIGEELLFINYNTAGYPAEMAVRQTFKVYSLTNQLIIGPHKQSYTLNFSTIDAESDLNIKLSKAYTGTPTTIISKILKQELQTDKSIDLDESSNAIKFVSPFWSPFKCINYATKNAGTPNKDKLGNYLFYESTGGYKFVSLSTLLSAPSAGNFIYSNDPARDLGQRDVGAEMTKIYEMRIDERFNTIDRLMKGAFSHTVIDHNLITKSIDKRYYHYSNDFSKNPHLEAHPVDSPEYQYNKDTLASSTTSVPFAQQQIKQDNLGKTLTSRFPTLNQLDLFKMDITVHGRTDLEVGDVVTITVGGIEKLTKEDKIGTEDYYNGRYLVTSIMHSISSLNKHVMVMQVSKESIAREYVGWGEKK